MSVILFVRISSELDEAELERRVNERKPQFEDVPGLIQKMYGRDPALRATDAASISSRIRLRWRRSRIQSSPKRFRQRMKPQDVRREVFQTLFPLRPGVGPVED